MPQSLVNSYPQIQFLCRRSYLQLYQDVRWLRQDSKPRQLAFDHRHFVTTVISRAHAAILIDLLGQVGALSRFESQPGEELGAAGEQANTTDVAVLRPRQQILQ